MFLSIVMPVYNSQDFLREALDSCLDQSLDKNDYEIICVNDGSTDNCPEILKEYASRYTNIVIVNQKNGGLVAAEKAGLKKATGDYIGFVDSDDIVKSDCFSILKKLSQKDYDIIGFKGYIFYGDISKSERNSVINDGRSGITSIIYRTIHIYKRDVIISDKVSFFPNIQYGEDELLYCFLSENASKIIETDNIFYFYRQRENSIMNQLKYSGKAMRKRIDDTINSMIILKEKIVSGEFKKPFSFSQLRDRYETAYSVIILLNKKEGKKYFEKMYEKGLFDPDLLNLLDLPDYKTIRNSFFTKQKKELKKRRIKKLKKMVPKPITLAIKKIFRKS